MQSLWPVSYTHLDVYKRQQLDTPDKRLKRCGQVRVGTAGDICHLSVNRAGTLLLVTDFVDKAVHFYEFLPNGAPGAFLARVPFEGKSTCLLYTSRCV